ncbi:MAG: hypothetical protein RBT11_08820 [Desulfobacterales bacterium]|jgi:hypothetical protein|nr:hypothetical protein [Desulfobacterales bacterium]
MFSVGLSVLLDEFAKDSLGLFGVVKPLTPKRDVRILDQGNTIDRNEGPLWRVWVGSEELFLCGSGSGYGLLHGVASFHSNAKSGSRHNDRKPPSAEMVMD